MIGHPPRTGTGVRSASLGYVAAADVLDLRLGADPAVRTSVVRWVPSTPSAPAIDFVLDQAGDRLVGLVVEEASQWVPPAALEGATVPACEVTASGRLWVPLVPEAGEVWRTATRVVPRGGSPALQLLWAGTGRVVAVEVEDVARLHPSVLLPQLQVAEG